MAEKRAGYSNFRILTRSALTAADRRRSDINIALPKRNTLSRGKFPPEDQGSKLLKSFPGVPNSADFGTVRRARALANFLRKKNKEVTRNPGVKFKYVNCTVTHTHTLSLSQPLVTRNQQVNSKPFSRHSTILFTRTIVRV